MPAWLAAIVAKLPISVQWLVPLALAALVKYVFPAIAKALPAEAGLIEDLAAYLSGGGVMPPALKAAHETFVAEKAKEGCDKPVAPEAEVKAA